MVLLVDKCAPIIDQNILETQGFFASLSECSFSFKTETKNLSFVVPIKDSESIIGYVFAQKMRALFQQKTQDWDGTDCFKLITHSTTQTLLTLYSFLFPSATDKDALFDSSNLNSPCLILASMFFFQDISHHFLGINTYLNVLEIVWSGQFLNLEKTGHIVWQIILDQ